MERFLSGTGSLRKDEKTWKCYQTKVSKTNTDNIRKRCTQCRYLLYLICEEKTYIYIFYTVNGMYDSLIASGIIQVVFDLSAFMLKSYAYEWFEMKTPQKEKKKISNKTTKLIPNQVVESVGKCIWVPGKKWDSCLEW